MSSNMTRVGKMTEWPNSTRGQRQAQKQLAGVPGRWWGSPWAQGFSLWGFRKITRVRQGVQIGAQWN